MIEIPINKTIGDVALLIVLLIFSSESMLNNSDEEDGVWNTLRGFVGLMTVVIEVAKI